MKYGSFNIYCGLTVGQAGKQKGYKISFTYAQAERIVKDCLKTVKIDCATLTQHAKGIWKTTSEKSLVITIMSESDNKEIYEKVVNLVKLLKDLLMQDNILLTFNEIRGALL